MHWNTQILTYLYACLKRGDPAEWEMLTADKIGIPASYWLFIIASLRDEGYITALAPVKSISGEGFKDTGISITPKGVEYLFDNGFMQNIKGMLKDIKDIISFVQEVILLSPFKAQG